MHESWAAGILIDKKIGKNLLIGTGLELVQHNEQLTLFEYKTENINAFPQDEVPADLRNQNGFLTK